MLKHLKDFAFIGWTGVDLFFVLSGFLITGILWDAKGEAHYFRNFYARRTLRIFPLYYGALVGLFVFLPALYPLIHHLPPRTAVVASDQIQGYQNTRPYWGWYATYLVDLLIARKGLMAAGHFWSLAVEEHFYLVWPLLVYFLRFRTLVFTSIGLVAGALVIRAALLPVLTPVAVYVLTPCRMDGLALGGLIALVLRTPEGLQKLTAVARVILPVAASIWIGLALVLGGWWQYGAVAQTVGYSVTIFFYASFLILALSSRRLASILSAKTFRFFGKYSYGIYVFHILPVFSFAPFFALGDVARYSALRRLLPSIDPSLHQKLWLLLDGSLYVIVSVGSSVLLALLSWRLWEQPFLSLKKHFPVHQRTGGGANSSMSAGPKVCSKA